MKFFRPSDKIGVHLVIEAVHLLDERCVHTEIGGHGFEMGDRILERSALLRGDDRLTALHRPLALPFVLDVDDNSEDFRSQHVGHRHRSEEHTSELQSLMRISYAVFCLKKKKNTTTHTYL